MALQIASPANDKMVGRLLGSIVEYRAHIISWHELVIPPIVSSKPEAMTLLVILAGLVPDYFASYTLMMAISVLGLAPTLLLVLVLWCSYCGSM
jgi:hypothetical protein